MSGDGRKGVPGVAAADQDAGTPGQVHLYLTVAVSWARARSALSRAGEKITFAEGFAATRQLISAAYMEGN